MSVRPTIPSNPCICGVCGKEHADPGMARACESYHERKKFAAGPGVLAGTSASPSGLD
ncbi:hypothetical protein [Cellulomonas sp. URHE0023]|uniref:hypothetical protein n=1 Tax=Cellulomonas sp. URHE0023 TaxID=1380354 RepID=UPI0012DF19B0|nr:hypothetical protein [Cellulomonas sp. URHE0023]